MKKTIMMSDDARQKMLIGLNTAVDLAKVTLGGKGKNITINTPGNLHITKDGVTVLKHVAMSNDVEDMGVKMVLEAAESQVAECADGTTSVSILLQAIVNSGIDAVKNDADPLMIKKGIEDAVEIVVGALKKMSKKIERDSEEVFQIAKVSAHGDEKVAKIIAEAIEKTGEHSNVTVQESRGTKTYVELHDGFKYNSGWLSHLFVNNDRNGTAEYEDPYILVYEGQIRDLKEIIEILEALSQKAKPLLIISDNMNGEALSSLALNVKRNGLQVVAINPFGHNREDTQFRLQDIATSVGTKVFSPDNADKLNEVTLEELGGAKKIIVSQHNTLIVSGNGKKKDVKTRIDTLDAQLKVVENPFDKELLKGRLASMTGGVGIIHVGGTLETEAIERKDRVDDALGSALGAVESGIVPGGGISLLIAKKALDKKRINIEGSKGIGMQIVAEALELPFLQILKNAGLDSEEIKKKVLGMAKGVGYNVETDEYVNMVTEGIIDPTKVEINVVKNAASIAIQFLNTEGIITPEINSQI